MQKKILISLAFLLSFFSCNFNFTPISQLWFYTYSSISSGNRNTNLTAASFLNLQNDGIYTRDFGKFDYGKWTFKDNELTLINYKNETFLLKVSSVSLSEMRVANNENQADNFASQPHKFKSPTDNPFSKENNLWRIPAQKNESDAEIKNRLFNHFKFWETYFTWALKNNIETIDVRSTPTPIKIYGNGFGLKPLSDLPDEWKSFFYNSDNLKRANDMIEYIFDNDNIAWAHTDNKYEMFISAFQQLEDKIYTVSSSNLNNISNSKNQ